MHGDLASMRAVFGPAVTYLTKALAKHILRHHGGVVWCVFDQGIQPETLGASVKDRMRLLGKLFIDKVTSEERGVYCRIGDYRTIVSCTSTPGKGVELLSKALVQTQFGFGNLHNLSFTPLHIAQIQRKRVHLQQEKPTWVDQW